MHVGQGAILSLSLLFLIDVAICLMALTFSFDCGKFIAICFAYCTTSRNCCPNGSCLFCFACTDVLGLLINSVSGCL
jgi:hypothetical protein